MSLVKQWRTNVVDVRRWKSLRDRIVGPFTHTRRVFVCWMQITAAHRFLKLTACSQVLDAWRKLAPRRKLFKNIIELMQRRMRSALSATVLGEMRSIVQGQCFLAQTCSEIAARTRKHIASHALSGWRQRCSLQKAVCAHAKACMRGTITVVLHSWKRVAWRGFALYLHSLNVSAHIRSAVIHAWAWWRACMVVARKLAARVDRRRLVSFSVGWTAVVKHQIHVKACVQAMSARADLSMCSEIFDDWVRWVDEEMHRKIQEIEESILMSSMGVSKLHQSQGPNASQPVESTMVQPDRFEEAHSAEEFTAAAPQQCHSTAQTPKAAAAAEANTTTDASQPVAEGSVQASHVEDSLHMLEAANVDTRQVAAGALQPDAASVVSESFSSAVASSHVKGMHISQPAVGTVVQQQQPQQQVTPDLQPRNIGALRNEHSANTHVPSTTEHTDVAAHSQESRPTPHQPRGVLVSELESQDTVAVLAGESQLACSGLLSVTADGHVPVAVAQLQQSQRQVAADVSQQQDSSGPLRMEDLMNPAHDMAASTPTAENRGTDALAQEVPASALRASIATRQAPVSNTMPGTAGQTIATQHTSMDSAAEHSPWTPAAADTHDPSLRFAQQITPTQSNSTAVDEHVAEVDGAGQRADDEQRAATVLIARTTVLADDADFARSNSASAVLQTTVTTRTGASAGGTRMTASNPADRSVGDHTASYTRIAGAPSEPLVYAGAMLREQDPIEALVISTASHHSTAHAAMDDEMRNPTEVLVGRVPSESLAFSRSTAAIDMQQATGEEHVLTAPSELATYSHTKTSLVHSQAGVTANKGAVDVPVAGGATRSNSTATSLCGSAAGFPTTANLRELLRTCRGNIQAATRMLHEQQSQYLVDHSQGTVTMEQARDIIVISGGNVDVAMCMVQEAINTSKAVQVRSATLTRAYFAHLRGNVEFNKVAGIVRARLVRFSRCLRLKRSVHSWMYVVSRDAKLRVAQPMWYAPDRIKNEVGCACFLRIVVVVVAAAVLVLVLVVFVVVFFVVVLLRMGWWYALR